MTPEPPAAATRPPRDEHTVIRPLRIAAAYSWRLIVVGTALYALAIGLSEVAMIVLALFLALLATALLRPPTLVFMDRGFPPAAAAAASMTLAGCLLAALFIVLVPPFVDDLGGLAETLRAGTQQVADWLLEGPLNLSENQLDEYLDNAEDSLRGNAGLIATGFVGGALVVVEVVAGLLLALVITFFFLKDGDRLSAWFLSLFRQPRQAEVAELASRSWETLSGYLRGMTLVALFDAVFIGIALALIGIPAALPLAVFTFFGAYIPIVGALVTGLAAVLVALVSDGLATAALVAAAVLVVQQVESNLLQPFVVARAVSVHPLVILLAVTTGALLGGIAGAVIAVPIAAVVVRIGEFLREREQPA